MKNFVLRLILNYFYDILQKIFIEFNNRRVFWQKLTQNWTAPSESSILCERILNVNLKFVQFETLFYEIHEIIKLKMDLFRRLESFCEACEDSETKSQQNSKFSFNKFNEIFENNQKLTETCAVLRPECDQLKEQVSKLKGRFFDLEVHKIKEKFAQLLKMFNDVFGLAENRTVFLSEFSEKFYKPTKKIESELDSIETDVNSGRNLDLFETKLKEIYTKIEEMLFEIDRLEFLREKAKIQIEDCPELRAPLLKFRTKTQNLSPDCNL